MGGDEGGEGGGGASGGEGGRGDRDPGDPIRCNLLRHFLRHLCRIWSPSVTDPILNETKKTQYNNFYYFCVHYSV